MLTATPLQLTAAVLFALALVHTFSAKLFERLAHRPGPHAGLWHLLGEVEVVFGLWAAALLVAMAATEGGSAALHYAESRQFTEPLFVFAVMVVAASQPIVQCLTGLLSLMAKALPLPTPLAQAWLGFAVVPLLGSLITEPAAMTLAALLLGPQVFRPELPERLKYLALGVLFVNISIGGTLTAFAAPPVLMVASTWQWDSAFMAKTFGWRAAIAVLINASLLCFALRRALASPVAPAPTTASPWTVSAIHLAFLAAVVAFAHHPVIFLGLFLLFLGYTQAYPQFQSPLIVKEALLVGFFLAGLVVLGGIQQWWLQPLIAGLSEYALFFGALGLTAVADNAALTYLGSLIQGISPTAQYMLVAGAVAGGGLSIVANAPNPAGAALLKQGFSQQSISALGLLLGALLPTATAVLLFLL